MLTISQCMLFRIIFASLWVGFVVSGLRADDKFDLVVVGGYRFNTESKSFEPNNGIGISKGEIAAVGLDLEQTQSEERIQLQEDEFLLPGLIDCHAHYNVRLIKRRREEFDVMPVVYLANGATTTFSCGEFDPKQMRQLRLDIESGKKIGPHLINSGPYFGHARPGWRNEKSADEIRREVDYWVEQGVGGFKAKAISPSDLKPLVDQAHKHGLTVTGHLGSGFRNSVNPRDAIEIGIDRIEHFIGGDEMPESKSAYDSLPNITRDQSGYLKAVQQFVDTGTVFDATLTAYGYPGTPKEEFEYWVDERQFFTEHMQQICQRRGLAKPIERFEKIYSAKLLTVGKFFELGGTLSLGTDHVSDGHYLPGFGVHREMDAYVRAGVPAADVLMIATINGARALGLEDSRGSIELGKQADLIVVTGDPSMDIRNTRTVHTVIKQGTVYKTEELLASVKGKLGPESTDEESHW